MQENVVICTMYDNVIARAKNNKLNAHETFFYSSSLVL